MSLAPTVARIGAAWALAALLALAPPAGAAPERVPALAADAVLSRIAFGSCLDQRVPQPIWDAVLASRPQLFLFLGDNVYGDVASPDLAELRQAYAAQARQPGFRRLRRSVPVLAIWDDHDYGVNDGGAAFPFRQESAALFADFWGLPPARRAREGLYHALIVGPPGRRVQVILLDTRSFRSPLRPTAARGAPGAERYLPDADPGKTMLGAAQWAWLAGELRRPAELRLLVSSIQVIAEGHGYERWGNLPRERERLFALIREAEAGVTVVLSGDRHLGAIYRIDNAVGHPLYEVTSSSLNRPFRDAVEPGPHRLGPVFGDENFGLVGVDWRTGRLRLELRDLAGRTVRSVDAALAELQPRR